MSVDNGDEELVEGHVKDVREGGGGGVADVFGAVWVVRVELRTADARLRGDFGQRAGNR